MCAGDSLFLFDEIIKNQPLLVAMALLAGNYLQRTYIQCYTRGDIYLKIYTES
jgi:hypothetical protein